MSYDKRQATEEFTRWSENYDRCVLQWLLFAPSHRAILGRISSYYGQSPIRILDIGCGTGVFAARARKELPNAQVVGLDLVAGMLTGGRERWREYASHVQPIQGDSERLPFAPGTFDVVTCSNSFHHYPNQQSAVSEMRRVLRPGGRLFLVDGYRDAPYGWFIYDVCVASIEGAVHHASRATMRQYLDHAGFHSVDQKVHRGFAPFLLNEGFVAPSTAIPRPHVATTSRPAFAESTSRPASR